MKRFLTVILLSVSIVFSAVAKSSRDPLIDFINTVYEKNSLKKSELLKYGFSKNSLGYETVWNDLTVQLFVDEKTSRISVFQFYSEDKNTFLKNWQMFIAYAYDNYDVKVSVADMLNEEGAWVSVESYLMGSMGVTNSYPYQYSFSISRRL